MIDPAKAKEIGRIAVQKYGPMTWSEMVDIICGVMGCTPSQAEEVLGYLFRQGQMKRISRSGRLPEYSLNSDPVITGISTGHIIEEPKTRPMNKRAKEVKEYLSHLRQLRNFGRETIIPTAETQAVNIHEAVEMFLNRDPSDRFHF